MKGANAQGPNGGPIRNLITGPFLGKNESSNFPGSIFEIFRFSVPELLFCLHNIFEQYVGEISRKNNKGVLERPGTKWKVLRAISSTLKC